MQDMAQALSTSEAQSTDRILSLKLIDDKLPLSSTGLVDRRLFTGENVLHAMTDPQTGLWTLRYEQGKTPAAFDAQFTSFKTLIKFATDYFFRRNIEIKEII